MSKSTLELKWNNFLKSLPRSLSLGKLNEPVLPLYHDIQQGPDESSSSAIQTDIRRFVREVPKIEELKKRKVDVYQHVSSKYKGAERLRANIYNSI
ncbi:uncharacterized protein RHIMIDRAFT_236521 [Rhizopus microsporus ATCC 52813]|uniref:Uncharacterized protein n=1 Tax=Rhizopus microsporus ATCC 52813 TaxID=1340429 RepID=A0A2G4SXG7_RHIZD|nr:uncharacterized protein RHIMIDRAFT_236521 [Rhizopus microsporus ATCC 52813]PHZ13461.1 hypothetical protein RHIMIDRAFT_236521 [Rhizopus microsporus ATCC 52813]